LKSEARNPKSEGVKQPWQRNLSQRKWQRIGTEHFFLVPRLLSFLCFVTGIVVGLLPFAVLAGATVSVIWNPSVGTNVAGYNIYDGPASRTYTQKINVGNSTNGTVSGLAEGSNYFFAVTAYDSRGLESDYSNELAYRVPTPKSNYLSVGVRVLTATNVLGPWTLWTNLPVYTATNPPGARYFSASLTITNTVR